VSLHGALPYYDSVTIHNDGEPGEVPLVECVPLNQDQASVRYLVHFTAASGPLEAAAPSTHGHPRGGLRERPPAHHSDRPKTVATAAKTHLEAPLAKSGGIYSHPRAQRPRDELYVLEDCSSQNTDPDAFALVMHALGQYFRQGGVHVLDAVSSIHRIHNQVLDPRYHLRKSEMILPHEQSKFFVHEGRNSNALAEVMSRGFWLSSGKRRGLFSKCLTFNERCPAWERMLRRSQKNGGSVFVLVCEVAMGKTWRVRQQQAETVRMQGMLQYYDSVQVKLNDKSGADTINVLFHTDQAIPRFLVELQGIFTSSDPR